MMKKDILVNIGVAAVSAVTMLVVRRKVKELVDRRRAELEMLEAETQNLHTPL